MKRNFSNIPTQLRRFPARGGLFCCALLLAGCTSMVPYFSSMGEDLDARVADEMGAATESIHLAIYTITSQEENPQIYATLSSKAKNRQVLIAADAEQYFEIADQRDLLDDLDEDTPAEVRLCNGHGGNIMHNKFAIIDGRTVITGSYNYTYYATLLNDENIVVISDDSVAGQYEEAFQEIWSRCTPLSDLD